jgi:predicted dehydrogenase
LDQALRPFPEERQIKLRELMQSHHDAQLEKAKELLKSGSIARSVGTAARADKGNGKAMSPRIN